MKTAYVATPLGTARLEGDDKGLRSIQIRDKAAPVSPEIPDCLADAARQLTEYFSGERHTFTLALAPVGTPFQKKVWHALLEIPFGQTLSYKTLSERLGDVKAIRAVAAANGKNPLWIVVPCHRVIGSDGSLVGYAGGVSRKKWLLAHESPEQQYALF